MGVLVGLFFLLRVNLGVFFLAGLMVDGLIMVWRQYITSVSLIQYLLNIFITFSLTILSFGWYTYQVWEKPFFSSNSLYQFCHFTRFQMFTNPWWKLYTPVGHVSNLDLFFAGPIPFLKKNLAFLLNNSVYFVFTFFGSIFLAAYSVYHSTLKQRLMLQPLVIPTLVMFGATICVLGFFTDGHVEISYLIFTLPILFILSGDGLYRFYRKFRDICINLQKE